MQTDKLVMAMVQREDAEAIVTAINQAGLTVTVLATVGGFLSASNVTLLMGLRADDVEQAVELIKAHSVARSVRAPEEISVGGATVFVFPIARHIHLTRSATVIDASFYSNAPGSMIMILAIVSEQQSDQILKTLTDWSYRGTLMSTTGGFLHRRNATVLIGARSDRVDSIVDQIRQVCEQMAQDDSAATIFVLNSEQFERM